MSRLTVRLMIVTMMIVSAGIVNARNFGVGAMLGEPTSLNGKIWTGRSTAIDFGLGWSTVGHHDYLHAHADYLFHDFGIAEVSKGALPLYYGVGGRIEGDRDTHAGLRIPVGLSYIFANSRFDLFFEIAPVLDLMPDTELDLEGGVGARFYF